MKKLNKKGFTIVELVIVIAVIAILAGVMIPTFAGLVDKANQSAAMQEVKNAYTARLAEDMATADISDDVVYGVEGIIVEQNGYLVSIDADGAPSIVESGEANFEIVDGMLAEVAAPVEPGTEATGTEGTDTEAAGTEGTDTEAAG